MRASDSFDKGGWVAVWTGLAEESIRPNDAARLADDLVKKQVGRPPLDPFWLEGAASLPKTKVSPAVRVKTALAWLESADHPDGWDSERIGFEMLYLLNTKFISWGDKADWKNGCESFAEAVVFSVHRPEIFEWRFDWQQIRNDWWANLCENHTPLSATALEALEKTREVWTDKEVDLAEIALDLWSRKPEKRGYSELGSSLASDALVSSWEKAVLSRKHENGLDPSIKPTL